MTGSDLPGDLDARGFERAVDRLVSLAAESSPSTDADGLRRFAERLAAELAPRGLAPRIEPAGESGLPIVVAASATSRRPPLLLLGHFDTVLSATTPRRDGDRLVATGSIDMKGGIATLLAALDLLAARGGATPPGLRLVLVPDEEVAGPISRRATAEHGAAARAVWVLEPGEPAGDGETIVVGRRGLEGFRLEVRGRSAHSGLHFWRGRSAIAAAAEWIAAAAGLSRRGGGPTVNVARVVGGDTSFVDRLAEQAGIVGTEAQLNVVPERAVVEGEMRFLRRADREAVEVSLRDAAAVIDARHEVESALAFGDAIEPVEATPPRLAAAEAVVAKAAARGWRLEIESDRGGVSFPNFLPASGTVPVLDGLGPVGGGMHTREEHVELRSFARRIVLLADLLEAESRSAD